MRKQDNTFGKALRNSLKEVKRQRRRPRTFNSIVTTDNITRYIEDSMDKPQVIRKGEPLNSDTEPLEVELLRLPTKPSWEGRSRKEYEELEKKQFGSWKKAVYEHCSSVLVPLERNLDLWKELWRVVERCNVLIEVVDSRNPLLFHVQELFDYADTVSKIHKIVLLNKADLLTERQESAWRNYFSSINVECLFYTTVHECSVLKDRIDELKRDYTELAIGFVGYPNVGKSSTINTLVGRKCVGTSSTPGKTKYMQTVAYAEGVTFYDCPGLVFPVFAPFATLVLNGMVALKNVKDFVSPVSLILELIPAYVVCEHFRIKTTNDPHSLIEEVALRGKNSSYVLTNSERNKAAVLVITAFIENCFNFCMPPPGVSSLEFNDY